MAKNLQFEVVTQRASRRLVARVDSCNRLDNIELALILRGTFTALR